MNIKVKAEPLGEIMNTKKGGYIRKFLVEQNGKKEVITVYSDNADTLKNEGVHDRVLVPGDFFFSPKA